MRKKSQREETFIKNLERIKFLYLCEDKGFKEICSIFSFSAGFLFRMFKKYGLKSKNDIHREFIDNSSLDIKNEFLEGKSVDFLSIKYKTCDTNISKILKSYGLETSRKSLKLETLQSNKDEVLRMFAENVRLETIGKQFNCSRTTVKDFLKREGLYFQRCQHGECLTQKARDSKANKLRESQIKNPRYGYRKGSGRGKHGYYKGIWCDSSWELAYVIYNIDHNIQFKRNDKRFSYFFKEKEYKYLPDFVLPTGEYVEIKGWYTPQVLAKIEQFKDTLVLIDKETIQPYLKYATETYGKDFIKLYET
jgi:hypothetical protein